jgi:uncharacterized protein (DUF1330 family)
MAGYIIAMIEVTDPEQYAQYARLTPAAIAKFGGRFVVRGGKSLTLEGPAESRRIVVLEFPTFEQAQAFYNSADYQHAKSFRDGAANASFVLVEGYAPPS